MIKSRLTKASSLSVTLYWKYWILVTLVVELRLRGGSVCNIPQASFLVDFPFAGVYTIVRTSLFPQFSQV